MSTESFVLFYFKAGWLKNNGNQSPAAAGKNPRFPAIFAEGRIFFSI